MTGVARYQCLNRGWNQTPMQLGRRGIELLGGSLLVAVIYPIENSRISPNLLVTKQGGSVWVSMTPSTVSNPTWKWKIMENHNCHCMSSANDGFYGTPYLITDLPCLASEKVQAKTLPLTSSFTNAKLVVVIFQPRSWARTLRLLHINTVPWHVHSI